MSALIREARRSPLSNQLRDLADDLQSLRFDGDVWKATLGGLQSAFGAAATVRYLPERVADGWSFESFDVAMAPGDCPEQFRSKMLPVMSKVTSKHGFYDPLCPDVQQRNRVLLLPEITQATGRPAAAMRELMLNLGIGRWDQIRVLVCDGAQLLSWVGLFSEERFGEAERTALQQLVPALQARLRFAQLERHAAGADATLEAMLEAMPIPCFLIRASGRLLDANSAARALHDLDPELVRRASTLLSCPDPRFEVHPVKVRGVTASYIAILRGEPAAPNQLRERARSWQLTQRQTTVLGCIVKGLANKEIASRLNIALGTVELHVSAILRKARAASRSALVAAYWSKR